VIHQSVIVADDIRVRPCERPTVAVQVACGREDRITLFVNRQGDTGGTNPPSADNEGMTFAIWGPWKKGGCRNVRLEGLHRPLPVNHP
jgi:hypothetical protein